MARHHKHAAASPSSSDVAAMRSYEIEQAVHTLRQRLGLASSKAHIPHRLGLESLPVHDHAAASTTATAPTASASPPSHHSSHVGSSTSPASTSETSIGTADGHAGGGHEAISADTTARFTDRQEPGRRALQPKPASKPKSRPSLYDVIFGSSPLSSGAVLSPKPAAPASNRRPSPHIRQGSSAQLEKIALSPQLGSPKDTRSSHDEHNHPSHDQLAMEKRLAASAPWPSSAPRTPLTPSRPSQQRHSMSSAPAPSLQQQVATSPAASYASPRSHGAHSNGHVRTPTHRRNRSLGGVLPNGHPASSLAQGLGIASGGSRTPLAKQASQTCAWSGGPRDDPASSHRSEAFSTFTEQRSHPSPPATGSRSFADPNVLTPRRRSRLAAAGTDSATSVERSLHVSRSSQEEDDAEGSSEAAAHSLLDLAASPSPLGSASVSRFPGHTPSLHADLASSRRRSHAEGENEKGKDSGSPQKSIKKHLLDDIERHGQKHHASSTVRHGDMDEARSPARALKRLSPFAATANATTTPPRQARHMRTGSLNSLGALQTPAAIGLATPSRDDFDDSPVQGRHGHKRTHSAIGGRVRLMSPPMTPPRSGNIHSAKRVHYDAHTMPSSPKTPTRSPPRLSSIEANPNAGNDDGKQELANGCLAGRDSHAPRALRDSDSSAETPRTPPQAAATPRTPKAPGSNFSYGDFLHVSPSPQPRQRTFSHTGLESAREGGAKGSSGMLLALAETPTRGTRAKARFLDFGDAIPTDEDSDHQGEVRLNAGVLSPSMLTATPTATPKGLGFSGLGGAFEPQTPAAVAAGDDAHVLVPGKRAANASQRLASAVSDHHHDDL